MKPIVKWAGGKTAILPNITEKILRFDLHGHCYYEPFVGGGSVFMSLQPERAVLNDLNEELITMYKQIKENPLLLSKELQKHSEKHNKEYYYRIRNLDRDGGIDKLNELQKTARFIYLNKTCYNGLYRVNAKNQFNTPIGRMEGRAVFNCDDILELSDYLNHNDIKFLCEDFETAVKSAKKGDVIYFDPPYDYEGEGFDRYTAGKFGKHETLRLSQLCNKLKNRGCHVVISNNDTSYVRKVFDGWNFTELEAPRYVNCKKERKKAKEVIIHE